MISVSRLLNGRQEGGDSVRFSPDTSYPKVLVFNVTKNCNLRCEHCYSSSGGGHFQDLSLDKWLKGIKEASDMGVKHILLSGGEPLARPDLPLIAKEAHDRGISVELSTNGTMLKDKLESMRRYVSYVGISVDGPEPIHDDFRGVPGAYKKALDGIRYSRDLGIKTGIRFTITSRNYQYIPHIFDLMREEKLQRVCFYHLGYAGRASKGIDVSNEVRYKVIRQVIELTKGLDFEVLTADNPVDGILIYHVTKSDRVKELLMRNGGNKSGERIADISPEGEIYPDQFTRIRIGDLENLRATWDNPTELLTKLRSRRKYVKCSLCPFFDMCNGGLRGRAFSLGDLWGRDPSCYLDQLLKGESLV
ncbi:radical SAM protein [Sulfuracidifex tepidarius]|uniref:7,8-dihydro-6-hydroxymethylpterin dimethyltransferase n=1 Tax=Sulfuracidifex tepidarius TaxID=1294262 RepID=A0A510DXF7_9CREN|nr:radical SAM protein [Sulfuracidifex tepidarius]BBG24859.1 7,8-dihydro-6-hydroxymethylpterin dimethyltransferase [Sulfuracidifex tepidarius]BBG27643.1 7,8-dihydro-6-hydroxymethylpterin dimethyltransferase [Sulfuracidifex tepidarius]